MLGDSPSVGMSRANEDNAHFFNIINYNELVFLNCSKSIMLFKPLHWIEQYGYWGLYQKNIAGKCIQKKLRCARSYSIA